MTDESYGIQGQRVRKNKGSESIRRETLQDPRLSFKATGILAFLLSLPDNWRTDAERLSRAKNFHRKAREGRDAIQSGLRELEDTGYLVRRKYQDKRGTWRWIWRYAEDPADLLDLNVSAGQTGNGLAGFGSPVDDPAVSDLPGDLEGLQEEVLEKRNLEEENLKPSTPATPDGVPDEQPHDHDPQVDQTPTSDPPRSSKARGSKTTSTPQVPTKTRPMGVGNRSPRADDLDSGADAEVVDLFGRATAETPVGKTKGRKAKGDDPERDRNASDVVAAWVQAYQTTGSKPPGYRCGQVGKEAKALLEAGNDVDRLITAAQEAGRQGNWSLERQLTAAARVNGWHKPKPGGVAGFTSPDDESVYDVPL